MNIFFLSLRAALAFFWGKVLTVLQGLFGKDNFFCAHAVAGAAFTLMMLRQYVDLPLALSSAMYYLFACFVYIRPLQHKGTTDALPMEVWRLQSLGVGQYMIILLDLIFGSSTVLRQVSHVVIGGALFIAADIRPRKKSWARQGIDALKKINIRMPSIVPRPALGAA